MGFKKTVEDIMEFKEDFVDKLNEAFGRWGLYCYDHPWRVIIITLTISLLPALGFLPGIAYWIDGADNLYSLPVSESRNVGRIHDNLFAGHISRPSFLIITSNPPGHNLFNWQTLEIVNEVDEIVRGKRIAPNPPDLPNRPTIDASKAIQEEEMNFTRTVGTPQEEGGYLVALPGDIPEFQPEFYDVAGRNESDVPSKKLLRYEDICAPDPVTGCKVQSVFEMGILEMKAVLGESRPPELWVFDGFVFNTKRKGFYPSFVLGEMTRQPCTRSVPEALISQIYTPDRYTADPDQAGYAIADLECITAAKALNFVYELDDSPKYLQRELAWELLFYEVMKANQYYGPLILAANAFRSRDDELSKSTAESDDVIFVVYTFIILIAYTTIINFNLDQYRTKHWSSLAGSLSSLLGLMGGLGLPALWGTAFVPTSLVAPFLVLGVGADDIFVAVSSYALAYGEDSARTRCGVALRGCGVSMVMTTITNVIAFAIGIQSPYLSIKNFCIFTLFGLLLSLIYELTFFYAVLCLDARREEEQRAFWVLSKPGPSGIVRSADESHEKFDIHKVVSTYQVVHVIVSESGKGHEIFDPVILQTERTDEKLRMIRVLDSDGQIKAEKTALSGMYGWLQRIRLFMTYRGRELWAPDNISCLSRETTVPDDEESSYGIDQEGVSGDEEGSEKAQESNNVYDPLVSPEKKKFNRYDLNKKLSYPVYRSEPKGSVGRHWRMRMTQYYTSFLLKPWVKCLVLLIFSVNFIVACIGLSQLKQGLEMPDLAPDGAYLRVYDGLNAKYFYENDLPVEIFFFNQAFYDDATPALHPAYDLPPGNTSADPDLESLTPWWDKRAIDSLREFVDRVNARPENSLLNDPLTRMVDDQNLGISLKSENKTEFQRALKNILSDPSSAYKQFEYDFVWDGDQLMGFRQLLLPTGTKSSRERAHWMLTTRSDCKWVSSLPVTKHSIPLYPMFYNYMLVFSESDIAITASVISAISTASLAMLVIAFLLIPEIQSGTWVILIMILIDLAIVGYMPFWEVQLNMISMVIIVISIGFAVDYSAHICYAFVNGVGRTRNARVAEAIVLVGTPLVHGATANFIGVMLLGFSTSYILRIFFKMLTLVILFGITHGMILLPVILSLFGNMSGAVKVNPHTLPKAVKWDDDEYNLVPMSIFSHPLSTNTTDHSTSRRAVWYRNGRMETDEPPKKCPEEITDNGRTENERRKTVGFDLPESASTKKARKVDDFGATPKPKRKGLLG